MPLKNNKPAGVAVTDDNIKTVKIDTSDRTLSFQVANLQMQGRRERQEDSFAFANAFDVRKIINNGMFAIVADGMGGMSDGKLVSEAAVSEYLALFNRLSLSENIPAQLSSDTRVINAKLFDRFQGSGGTTVVLMLFYNSQAYWLSVGDSTIYLKRDGGLYKLNCNHTYINQLYAEELENETIDKQRVESDPDKARLSEFMGIDELEKIDYNLKPLKLKAGDVFLLCSDGVSEVATEEEILRSLSLPVSQACVSLNEAVLSHAKTNQDNYTGAVISVIN